MASAWRKWTRETAEHGNDPSGPSERKSAPVAPSAPSAEKDQVTDEPVINQETGQKYMKEVKETFKDDQESYQKFVELIQDVRRKQVDYVGLGNRVKELFRSHTHLILGFNMFLPEGHQITLPSTEPPEDSVKSQQGIMLKRKVEALGKLSEFREILALYKKQSHSIDDVYKLAKTLFADRDDILADFRTFLPPSEGFNSERPAQEPDQQRALVRTEVRFVHLSDNVRENEEPGGESSRRAKFSSKGKEKLETTNSKKFAGKRKERTSNRVEEARTNSTQEREPSPPFILTRNASRRQQVQTAPTNAAAAPAGAPGSPRPASNKRVSAGTAAKRPSLLPKVVPNTARGPPPPLPSIAELQERLKNVSMCKCCPDCKACEPVEYPIFDWQAEDPEYYAKGKANRERERQALIARGVPGSFNDS